MNTKKFSVLLAALMLVLVQLACAAGEPALTNTRTARDQDGNQLSANFGAFDTIFVVSDLANGAAGNVITSKWYAENVQGFESNTLLDEADITVTENDAPFNGTIYFYFEAPSGGWSSGSYKIEIYFNGALSSTVNFYVQ